MRCTRRAILLCQVYLLQTAYSLYWSDIVCVRSCSPFPGQFTRISLDLVIVFHHECMPRFSPCTFVRLSVGVSSRSSEILLLPPPCSLCRVRCLLVHYLMSLPRSSPSSDVGRRAPPDHALDRLYPGIRCLGSRRLHLRVGPLGLLHDVGRVVQYFVPTMKTGMAFGDREVRKMF